MEANFASIFKALDIKNLRLNKEIRKIKLDMRILKEQCFVLYAEKVANVKEYQCKLSSFQH